MNELAKLFAALADVNRLRLLNLMREGEICVCYLQGTLKTNQPRISRHLAYLKKAGLVEATKRGKWHYYHLKPQPAHLKALMDQAMESLANERLGKKDLGRIREILCCPSKFGFSTPVEASDNRSAGGCK